MNDAPKTCECGTEIEDWAHQCYWCARQEHREEIADLCHEEQTEDYDS